MTRALIVCQPRLAHYLHLYRFSFQRLLRFSWLGLGVATNSKTNICLSLSADEFLEITQSETAIERVLRNAAPPKAATHRI